MFTPIFMKTKALTYWNFKKHKKTKNNKKKTKLGKFSIWLIFLRWVETTNEYTFVCLRWLVADSTMVTHQFSPPFGECIFFYFCPITEQANRSRNDGNLDNLKVKSMISTDSPTWTCWSRFLNHYIINLRKSCMFFDFASFRVFNFNYYSRCFDLWVFH